MASPVHYMHYMHCNTKQTVVANAPSRFLSIISGESRTIFTTVILSNQLVLFFFYQFTATWPDTP